MRKFLLILICLSTGYSLSAQIQGFYDGKKVTANSVKYYRAPKHSTFLSFSFGLSNYLGDLGGNTGIGKKFFYDNNFKKNTFFYGFSISHLRRDAVGFRLNYTAGKIAGSDHDAAYRNETDDAYFRYKRNLDFRSKISELSLLLEVYPFKFASAQTALHRWNVQPYLLGGIGLFSFNPQGSYFDELADDYVWVDLARLHTEGQGMNAYPDRKPYALTQMNLPFGFGVHYDLGLKTSLSLEFVGRKLSTDYLDDVSTTFIDASLFDQHLNEEDAALAKIIYNKSNLIDPDHPYRAGEQRGNPANNDFYYSFNLKFSIKISKMKIPFIKKHYKFDDREICD
ncbi:MAG: hypothetical protein JNJ58_05810 [Chitinophagaceae bacterium]|nr:hypothetical protein [Chitinophagaceae bacterium]